MPSPLDYRKPVTLTTFDDTKIGDLKKRWDKELASAVTEAALERALAIHGIDTEDSEKIKDAVELAREKPAVTPVAGAPPSPPGYDIPSLSGRERGSTAYKLFEKGKANLNDIVTSARKILKKAEELADGQMIESWKSFADSTTPLAGNTLGTAIQKALATADPVGALNAARADPSTTIGPTIISDSEFTELKKVVEEYVTTNPSVKASPRETMMVQIIAPGNGVSIGEPAAATAAGPRPMRAVDVGLGIGSAKRIGIKDPLGTADEALGKKVAPEALAAIRDLVDAPEPPFTSFTRAQRMKLTSEALKRVLVRKGVRDHAEAATNAIMIMMDSERPGKEARNIIFDLGTVNLLTEARMLQDHLPQWVSEADTDFVEEHATNTVGRIAKAAVALGRRVARGRARQGLENVGPRESRSIIPEVAGAIDVALRMPGATAGVIPTVGAIEVVMRTLPADYQRPVLPVGMARATRTTNPTKGDLLAKDVHSYLTRGRMDAVLRKIEQANRLGAEAARQPIEGGALTDVSNPEASEKDALANMSTIELIALRQRVAKAKSLPKPPGNETTDT